MGKISSLTAAGLLLLVTFGCSGTKHETVTVPPRIDLTQHDTIGVIDFTTTARGELGPFTTRRFTELARRDQGLVRIIEFGSESEALSSVGENEFSTETLKALGKKHGVRTIITGELTISEVKPDIRAELEALVQTLAWTHAGRPRAWPISDALDTRARVERWLEEAGTEPAGSPREAR